MAGDWIKLEHSTPDKPEVVKLAAALGLDQDAVVGKLVRLWIWADQQSVSGNALTVTNMFIDRITFCNGFAVGLVKVGWLSGREGLLTIPNFDRHNGQTAKNRAITNRRVATHRAKGNYETVTNVTEDALQKPLPEKRREEYNRTNRAIEQIPSTSAKDQEKAETKTETNSHSLSCEVKSMPKDVDDVYQFFGSLAERPMTPSGLRASADSYYDWLINQGNWAKLKDWRSRGRIWAKQDGIRQAQFDITKKKTQRGNTSNTMNNPDDYDI